MGTWASAQRMRAGIFRSRTSGWRAGCPGLRGSPDVRGGGPDVRALWLAFCREMPRGRMSGPGGRMSGSWSCFPVFSLHQLVHDLGDLSIFKLFSEVVSFTPEHTKHTRLR